MRICVIGDCGGHIGSVFGGGVEREFVGAAVSGPGESMDGFLKFAKTKGYAIPYFDDWKVMLLDQKPDVVAVDTVFSRHSEVAEFALSRGISVFTEKPVATELCELDRLEAAMSVSGAKMFAMFTARFEPWFFTAKKYIDSGAVGKILMINGQKSYKLGRRAEFYSHRDSYGGTIPWVAIHSIDQVLWLSGKKCRDIFARHSSNCNGGNGDLEMTALISMELEDGIVAGINADYLRPGNAPTHGDDRIRVAGTDGVVEVRRDRVYLINKDNDGSVPLENLTPPPIFDGFVEVLGGSRDSIYAGCDGIYATKAALLARKSADTGVKISL